MPAHRQNVIVLPLSKNSSVLFLDVVVSAWSIGTSCVQYRASGRSPPKECGGKPVGINLLPINHPQLLHTLCTHIHVVMCVYYVSRD